MKFVTQVLVSLNIEGKRMDVGELIQSEGKVFFKYYASFIKSGIEISPFKLPLTNQPQSVDTMIFDGLFGVFNDSLPDGWGRLLLDRWLISNSIDINQITSLDRLSYVGTNGLGALEYKPAINSVIDEEKVLELDAIAMESERILKGRSSEIITELVNLGGSSGGARPKVNVGYNASNGEVYFGQGQKPKGFEEWIVKFPSSYDSPAIALIEFVYYKMALAAGLNMSESRLFQGDSGQYYFGTKRFDRMEGKKLHMHSASGLMHDNFRLSSLDYGHLMDAAFRLENSVDAYEKVFRLAAFNVYSNNRDDHSKNFSFLMDQKGNWQFSPVYDLTFSISSHGFHSTTVAGEGKKPGKKHLMELAQAFSLSNAEMIIEEVKDAVNTWGYLAKKVGLDPETMKSIQKVIAENLKN